MPHKPDPTLSRKRPSHQLAHVTVWALEDLIAIHARARALMRRIIGWSDRLQRSGKLRVMAADQIDLAEVTIAIAQLTLELEEMERITRLALRGEYRHKPLPLEEPANGRAQRAPAGLGKTPTAPAVDVLPLKPKPKLSVDEAEAEAEAEKGG